MSATIHDTTDTQTSIPATMQAIVHDTYGTADVLHAATIAVPTIKDDEVLVRVHAAGVDRGTVHMTTGKPYAMRAVTGLRRPKNRVAGFDLSGVVVAVGAGVTRFAVGDEVFGIGRGSFAEYAAAKETKLAAKPKRLSFELAAALPVSGLTAIAALSDRIDGGQKVLVIGASGGVGSYVVQIAKAAGAEVTGVCSTSKVDLVRSLGADHVVDYEKDDFAAHGMRHDLIIDIGGSSPRKKLRSAVERRGTIAFVGGEGAGQLTGMGRQLRAAMLSPFVPDRSVLVMAKEHFSGLEQLVELVDSGDLTPSIGHTYALADAAAAVAAVDAGQARGKLVITIRT